MKTKTLYLIFAFLLILQPALQADENPYTEIKFTWVRTFHVPIIITVWNYPSDGIFQIKTEIYSGSQDVSGRRPSPRNAHRTEP